MANPDGKNPNFDTVGSKRRVVSGLGATKTLSVDDSGSVVLFDKADGIVVTLPVDAPVGTTFDFAVSVTLTSNLYKFITGAGTELLVGRILGCDTDSSNTVAVWPGLVGSSYIAVSMDKTTTGGIKGDSFTVTKLNSTTWLCNGAVNNNGTVATPYSAS
jgi:hypothetical protein